MYANRDLNLMDVIIFKCLIMYVMKIFSNPHFWAWDFECLVSKFQQDITQEFSQLPQFYLWQKKLPNISIFTSGTKKASLFLWSNCPYPWQSAIDRYRWTARGPALVDTTVFPSAATAAAATTALSAVIMILALFLYPQCNSPESRFWAGADGFTGPWHLSILLPLQRLTGREITRFYKRISCLCAPA